MERAPTTTKRFLIELTDARFFTAENADVLAFIRLVNPFAHTDVGTIVFDCADAIDGAEAYCPLPSSCAYVVLHTPSNRVVAIAYGQRGLAVRLDAAAQAEAIAAGGSPKADIGADWVEIDPWPTTRAPDQRSACEWMRRAYADALGA